MKYCRFVWSGKPHYGRVESMGGRDMITQVAAQAPVSGATTQSIRPLGLDTAKLLAPVRPSKVVCVGRNYREHAAELGNPLPQEPLLFLKPTSAIIAPGARIRLPDVSERVDHEGELGVVIAKRCRKLRPDEDVKPYIRGYTCVNDVTARDLQNKDGQWTRAKGFDTFCPVGPIVTDEVDPWKGALLETRLNGEVRQSGNTSDFIFPLDHLLRYISQVMTLYPGDLIATGTPSGVGPMRAGDIVEVSIAGIGTLANPVVEG